MMFRGVSVLGLALVAACSPVKVIQPLAPAVRQQLVVVDVDIASVGGASEKIARSNAKIARRLDGKSAAGDGCDIDRSKQAYEQMFVCTVAERLARIETAGTRPVRVVTTLDKIRYVDPLKFLLIGDADKLYGLVEIHDAETGERLGAFRIKQARHSADLVDIVIFRGNDVREKMARRFAKKIGKQIAPKPVKA